MSKRFTERNARALSQGRVDREAGILYGVKLLGADSRNGRKYTNDAMAAGVPKYAGKKIYVNHPESHRMGEDRSFHDWVGVIENPRYRDGGIFGDVRLRKQSPRYQEILEAAEEFPRSLGFSHVAEGDSHILGGIEYIEEIHEVHSVDLVMDSATTAGLFEGHSGAPSPGDYAQRDRLQAELTEILRDAVSTLADALTLLASRKPARSSRAAAGDRPDESGRSLDFDAEAELGTESYHRNRYSLESIGPAPPIRWNG